MLSIKNSLFCAVFLLVSLFHLPTDSWAAITLADFKRWTPKRTEELFNNDSLCSNKTASNLSQLKCQDVKHSVSWYDSANWHSQLYNSPHDPDAYRVPCAFDDISLMTSSDPMNIKGEASRFKITFNDRNKTLDFVPDTGLLVAALWINDVAYDSETLRQQHLISIDFNVSSSAMTQGASYHDPHVRHVIKINSSNIVDLGSGECLQESGCMCYNDLSDDIMSMICSFVESVHHEQLPCYDPIQLAGYCNKQCASNLEITIDPVKFEARFFETFVSTFADSMTTPHRHLDIGDIAANDDADGAYDDSGDSKQATVYVIVRRISTTRVDVTLIDNTSDDDDKRRYYARGQAHELAKALYLHVLLDIHMNRIYGIVDINMTTSTQWHTVRLFGFWSACLLAITLLVAAMAVINYYIHGNANTTKFSANISSVIAAPVATIANAWRSSRPIGLIQTTNSKAANEIES